MRVTMVACVLVLVWFAGRARLGARARRVANVRLRLVDRGVAAIGAPLVRSVVMGGLVAAIACGWWWVPAGAAGGGAWWLSAQRRALGRQRARLDEQVPDAMRAIAAGLRAGGSLPLAIAAAGEEMPSPLGAHLARCAARVAVGMPLELALARLRDDTGGDACARLVETLLVGAVAGAALPGILDAGADAHEGWARLERDRRAASAQVRLSAMVVGAMPLAFLLLAGPAARGPMRVLLREPAGWMLLATGLGLDALGWAWMRRLSGGPR